MCGRKRQPDASILGQGQGPPSSTKIKAKDSEFGLKDQGQGLTSVGRPTAMDILNIPSELWWIVNKHRVKILVRI